MDEWPRISVVTPSYNQGRYIAETIESVLAQDYPNLEHIVVDGGSTDETPAVLGRYPHLQVICEPDRGQADAINKGFRLATGQIWGFLNSDDTLLPGALRRVAREIDPSRGRHVVMGRCRFVDEQGAFLGVEHPSHFASHRRVLAIWKGYTIPQPAVFWTPEVWHTCGPLDENERLLLDYDLFCRFSRRYRFHFIDQVLATYRLHPESKTQQWNEAERLEDSIRVSRRYWGSPLSPQRWQLALSLAWYRFNRTGRARGWLKQAQEAWRCGRRLRAVPYLVAGGVLGPEVAFYVGVYPHLRERARGAWGWAMARLAPKQAGSPQTAAYLERTTPWEDGWAGPLLRLSQEAAAGARQVAVEGWVDLTYITDPFILTVRVDAQVVGRQRIEETGPFRLELPLPRPLGPGPHQVEVQASAWWVPARCIRTEDHRPLAWRIAEVRLLSAVGGGSEN